MVLPVESEEHLAHPKYRPDIDGLRAVAVLSVIAFHAFPTLMPGGFIGVDIFFVISGYLISTIIFESLDSKAFSFWEFYGRRIRRIFPALSVVLLTSLLLGWLVLVAGEFRQLGRHVVSGAAFVSNFRLWKESGYFDSVAELKPLLHLWSLGIEEQFYIVWPLLLWGTFKYRAIRLPLVVVVAGISFYLNLKYAGSEPVAAFYSPLARFWELLLGALVAYAVEHRGALLTAIGKPNGTWPTTLSSCLGGGLLIAGFVVISKDRMFPGAWALLPTLGAALTIISGPHEWINRRILSSRVLVWIGVISFPLYLWHWPLLSFARIVENGLPSLQVRLLAVVTTVVLAWGTYVVIEKPLRFGGQAKAKVATLALLMCFIAITGMAIGKEHLLPRTHGNPILKYFEFSGYPKPDGEYVDGNYSFGALGDREPVRKVLMLGDSHAQQYRNTFATLLGTSTASIGASRVQVLYNLDYLDPSGLLEAAKRVRDDKFITRVVISKFWALTYGSDKINYAVRCCGNALGGSVGGDAYREPPTVDEMAQIDSKITTAARLLVDAGKKVYFILDNPFGEELAPQSLVRRSFISGVEVSISPLSAREARQRAEPARSRIINIAKSVGAEVIDPFEYLCDAETCPVLTSDGIPIYKDYDHLSIDAVTRKVSYLNRLVKE